ncbi:acylphosphatase [Chloroflexota bacterium]
MADLVAVQVLVYGHVQHVFFRAFTSGQAGELGLTGCVRNLPSGEAVEIQAEGERKQLEKLIGYLKLGSPKARVEKVVTKWSEYTGNYSGFNIRY